MIRIPRIARRRPREIEAGAADREFVGREFAEHDCAGAAQTRHANRIGRGDVVAQDLRMAGRRQTHDIDDVLDADRYAVQRPARAAGDDLGFRGLRRRHGGVGVEANKDVELRIEPADPFEQRRHQLDRRNFPGDDSAGRADRGHPVKVVHSPAPARIGGHGSARGSVGTFILETDLLACSAAAATSSGNSTSALSSPAHRANSSIIALSMMSASLLLMPTPGGSVGWNADADVSLPHSPSETEIFPEPGSITPSWRPDLPAASAYGRSRPGSPNIPRCARSRPNRDCSPGCGPRSRLATGM